MKMPKKCLILLAAILIVGTVALGCAGNTGNLRVQVVGDNNTPLAGFKVVSNEQPAGQLKVTGLTDSDGTFAYEGIKAGAYNFYVNGAGYEQKIFDVTVPRGKTANVTITMTPASPPPTT
jgi:uncharacterized membrane protein